ncbi:hypothetical protein [Staphylococcus sp. EZ-P03]|uniref:hypothetical protein n=1 Tax=Staphylococcus sp. EZ-P03 TaxID=2282739 RepID=UPI000DF76554|nr:hypothetical protein [Staphylococcus sp. EZ-P03]
MLIYIVINIVMILASIFIDMFFNSIHQVRLSSILIAVTLNSITNMIIIGKYDFITYSIVAFISIWTLLALLTDWKLKPIIFETQKFIAFVVFTIMSLSMLIIFNTSEKSYYMSIPYLSPVFFLFGASLIFLAVFHNTDQQHHPKHFWNDIAKSLTIGTVLIILSFLVITLLTPFWYIFLIVYSILLLFVLWTKPFCMKFD